MNTNMLLKYIFIHSAKTATICLKVELIVVVVCVGGGCIYTLYIGKQKHIS